MTPQNRIVRNSANPQYVSALGHGGTAKDAQGRRLWLTWGSDNEYPQFDTSSAEASCLPNFRADETRMPPRPSGLNLAAFAKLGSVRYSLTCRRQTTATDATEDPAWIEAITDSYKNRLYSESEFWKELPL